MWISRRATSWILNTSTSLRRTALKPCGILSAKSDWMDVMPTDWRKAPICCIPTWRIAMREVHQQHHRTPHPRRKGLKKRIIARKQQWVHYHRGSLKPSLTSCQNYPTSSRPVRNSSDSDRQAYQAARRRELTVLLVGMALRDENSSSRAP